MSEGCLPARGLAHTHIKGIARTAGERVETLLPPRLALQGACSSLDTGTGLVSWHGMDGWKQMTFTWVCRPSSALQLFQKASALPPPAAPLWSPPCFGLLSALPPSRPRQSHLPDGWHVCRILMVLVLASGLGQHKAGAQQSVPWDCGGVASWRGAGPGEACGCLPGLWRPLPLGPRAQCVCFVLWLLGTSEPPTCEAPCSCPHLPSLSRVPLAVRAGALVAGQSLTLCSAGNSQVPAVLSSPFLRHPVDG